jgi:hypothetical protein
MMTTNATPPAWAELALRAFLSERDFESVSGDLLEEYRENIYGTRGRLRANVWYAGQVLGYGWRHAGVWAIVFAVAFLARTAMDWYMPAADFQTRSAVSTLVGIGIFLGTGFWAGLQSGSYAAGGVVGLAVATLALPIQLVGAVLLLAGSHDPSVLTAIRNSGGLGEVFTMPLMTAVPGLLLGAIGGVLGTTTRRLRASGDVISP